MSEETEKEAEAKIYLRGLLNEILADKERRERKELIVSVVCMVGIGIFFLVCLFLL